MIRFSVLLQIAVLPVLLLAASPAGIPPADSFVTATNASYIDWTRGEIVVTGSTDIPEVVKDPDDFRYDSRNYEQPRNAAQARMLAKAAALRNALRTAAVLIAGISVDSKSTLADAMKNPVVNSKINSFVISGYTIRGQVTDSLSSSVTLRWPLYGDGGLIAMNDEPDFKDNFLNFYYEDLEAWPGRTNRTAYSGIVISAPYLKLTPALAPRLVSESGRTVYAAGVVYARDAARSGVALYALSPFELPKAVKSDYYHCTAVNTTVFRGTDIVISDNDAAALLGNPSTREALRHCRVILLAAER